jgi:hypothetical protein
VHAAELVLRYDYSHDSHDLERAGKFLADSLVAYKHLAALTAPAYQFANSMHTSQRKIPVPGAAKGVGTNFLWSQLVPMYERELADFQTHLAELEGTAKTNTAATSIQPWPAAKFKLISTNAETYPVAAGAKVFTDESFTIQKLAPELNGLTGIRFSLGRGSFVILGIVPQSTPLNKRDANGGNSIP